MPRLIDGPDAAPATVLQQAFRQQVWLEQTERPGRPLFIGGQSMGGREASLLIDELAASDGVCGCFCLGYLPFPPARQAAATAHRALGRREELDTYALPPQVQMRWIASGDHSFKPTRSLGLSEAENWAAAVGLGDRFLYKG